MIYTNEILIILIAILVVCMLGFKKYIWFISIGYGLSIFIVGLMTLILFDKTPALIISSIILMGYGLRLGGFLAYRELKSSSYNKKMKNEISDGSNMTFLLKIAMWIMCAILYLFMTSPVIYRFINNDGMDTCFIVGMVISVIGIFIESLSDYQKSKSKKINPNKICTSGLFKIVRCPNYFGEMLIWTGVFVSSFTTLTSFQWLISIIGYIGIIYIMFSGARRLELRQERTYKDDKEYREYAKKTPILLPLIPLYSVKKYKWLVG